MRMKWILGLSMSTIAGSMLATPTLAQSLNQSDVTGTNVGNGPAIFGSSNSGGSLSSVFAAAGTAANAADALADEGGATSTLPGTELLVASTKQLSQVPLGLSAETQNSLVQLRDYLRSLSTQARPNLRAMDNHIRPVASGLAKDLAALDADCKAQNTAACESYNRLAPLTVSFLDALDALDAEFRKSLPIARTF